MLTALAAAGCTSSATYAVDADAARAALKTTLDAWKGGEPPDSLQSASPAIIAQDMEWSSGAKLIDYDFLGDKPADANLDARVKLTISARGKKIQREARYLVTTRPAVTVFRDMMN
jgi:hypothetical protein